MYYFLEDSYGHYITMTTPFPMTASSPIARSATGRPTRLCAQKLAASLSYDRRTEKEREQRRGCCAAKVRLFSLFSSFLRTDLSVDSIPRPRHATCPATAIHTLVRTHDAAPQSIHVAS